MAPSWIPVTEYKTSYSNSLIRGEHMPEKMKRHVPEKAGKVLTGRT